MLQLAVTGDSFFIYNNYPVNWKDCVLVFATGNISGILNSGAQLSTISPPYWNQRWYGEDPVITLINLER
jgi:hypothetical protein